MRQQALSIAITVAFPFLYVTAFTGFNRFGVESPLNIGKSGIVRYSSMSLASIAEVEEETSTKEVQKLYDSNENEFVEGAVVRVAAPIKAFHVGVKFRGSYDEETKELVPVSRDVDREDRCLVLPVGMRGVVMRVYDIVELGPSHPIKVKFTPGENIDEGYDPPNFIMHFETYEVEVVK